jgi:Uma2 family endonuclease
MQGDESLYQGRAFSYETSGLSAEYGKDGHISGKNDANELREDGAIYSTKVQGEYTLEDYYALPEERRVELIDGVFYDMTAPRVVHQDISSILHFQIADYINKNRGNCKVFSAPVDVQLDCDDKTMVEPDIVVICDRSKIKGFGIYGAPDFVIEILSKSTKRKDLTIKVTKYCDAGVKEYWIIDPHKRILITYNFADEDWVPEMHPLKGEVPVAIYDGKLKIALDKVMESIEEFGE